MTVKLIVKLSDDTYDYIKDKMSESRYESIDNDYYIKAHVERVLSTMIEDSIHAYDVPIKRKRQDKDKNDNNEDDNSE